MSSDTDAFDISPSVALDNTPVLITSQHSSEDEQLPPDQAAAVAESTHTTGYDGSSVGADFMLSDSLDTSDNTPTGDLSPLKTTAPHAPTGNTPTLPGASANSYSMANFQTFFPADSDGIGDPNLPLDIRSRSFSAPMLISSEKLQRIKHVANSLRMIGDGLFHEHAVRKSAGCSPVKTTATQPAMRRYSTGIFASLRNAYQYMRL